MALSDLFLLSGTLERDSRIEAWFSVTDPHRLIVRPWFERMRACGAEVREQFHDGCPTACVGEAPFAYVGGFKAHSSVGFFRGSELPDPAGLLEGSGKNMRHVKLRPGKPLKEAALASLIDAAYRDMRVRLGLVRSKVKSEKQGMKKSDNDANATASSQIDARIAELGDWRGETLSRIRALIHEADPEVVETWKWRGVPVWEHDGIITTGETYKAVVKLTFAKGAALPDPAGLFNSSLEGNTRRAIDFREGDTINAKALKALIGAAVTLNTATRKNPKG